MHLFAKEQPDLNWENADCRKAIHDSAMRFWLNKGVDGFRIDTVNMYSKGPVSELRDAPIVNPGVYDQPAWMLFTNGPRMHEFLREMRSLVLDKYDTMTVGELPHTPDTRKVLEYVGAAQHELSMVFQFDIVDLGQGSTYKYQYTPWKLPQLKAIVAKWQQFIEGTDGWTTAFCENHDQGRSVSRYASDEPQYRAVSAKMLAVLMCCLTGTLFVYQGQEIGMVSPSLAFSDPTVSSSLSLTLPLQVNIPKDWPIEEYLDIEGRRYYDEVAKATNNDPEALSDVVKNLSILGRDNARTPMQWDNSAHGGFTNAEKPWMRVNDNYTDINVARQLAEPDSVFKFWQSMIKFRKAHADLLVYGTFEVLNAEDETTFVFWKKHAGEKALVALNFSSEDQSIELPEDGNYVLQADNYHCEGQSMEQKKLCEVSKVSLRPWEAQVYIHHAY